MPDNPKLTGKADDTRISLSQEHEVYYWIQKFDVSEAKLRTAVQAVGPMVADVKRYLGK